MFFYVHLRVRVLGVGGLGVLGVLILQEGSEYLPTALIALEFWFEGFQFSFAFQAFRALRILGVFKVLGC